MFEQEPDILLQLAQQVQPNPSGKIGPTQIAEWLAANFPHPQPRTRLDAINTHGNHLATYPLVKGAIVHAIKAGELQPTPTGQASARSQLEVSVILSHALNSIQPEALATYLENQFYTPPKA